MSGEKSGGERDGEESENDFGSNLNLRPLVYAMEPYLTELWHPLFKGSLLDESLEQF